MALSNLTPTEVSDLCSERRRALEAYLLAQRSAAGFWEGRLSSSALSTAVAVFALAQVDATVHAEQIRRGLGWLAATQNTDGGWGDTPDSPANLSTTLLVWCAETATAAAVPPAMLTRTEEWLRQRMGTLSPAGIATAVLGHYGQDQTFSAPILTMLALAGRLDLTPSSEEAAGDEASEDRVNAGQQTAAVAKSPQPFVVPPSGGGLSGGACRLTDWKRVPQLPFELVLLPRWSFRAVRLSVVSYALPALVAVGLARHRHRPVRNPLFRGLRNVATAPGLSLVAGMQPASGGFLEAAPLTAFVVMCLAHSGYAGHRIVANGVRFLVDSMREDGSWPIDTNLATWVSTLALNALSTDALSAAEKGRLRQWLLTQQFQSRHAFTGAAPGGWGWTDRSGAVPDGDDTAGALLALRALQPESTPETLAAAVCGVRWLLGLQNRDGGIPTFCRGWGRLPFDRSCPDITAHVLRAFAAWREELPSGLRWRVERASRAALAYLRRAQRADGAWLPLWFGNQAAPRQENPVYGTGRVILGLCDSAAAWPGLAQPMRAMAEHATAWLVRVQNPDGGWGGDAGAPSAVEETGVALTALAAMMPGDGLGLTGGTPACDPEDRVAPAGFLHLVERPRPRGHREPVRPCAGTSDALHRGVVWLVAHTAEPATIPASPCGLYFSSLWYSEQLYPRLFALEALKRVVSRICG